MKILFLISRFLDGGIDTVLVEYLNAMCQYTDYEVTLAIGMKMNEAEVFLPRISEKVHIEYLVDENWLTAYKREKHHHRKNTLLGICDEIILNPLRRILMHKRLHTLSQNYDVVIDFDACFGSFIHDTPAKAKKLVWFHFSLDHEAKHTPKRIRRLRKQFAFYDKVILIADDMVKEAKELMPEHNEKFCRIYNCLNKEEIERKADLSADDDRISKPFFIAVERLEESQKDLTTLIKAYATLVRRFAKESPSDTSLPYLYIIGEGQSHRDLQQLIDELSMSKKITLLGFRGNPYPWIRQSIALVHSSKFEGLPTVLIEALFLGKVVIATNCPVGPSEILNQGKCGILTPVGNADALAKAMQAVLDKAPFISGIKQDAIEHRQLFLPEYSIKQLCSTIYSLL